MYPSAPNTYTPTDTSGACQRFTATQEVTMSEIEVTELSPEEVKEAQEAYRRFLGEAQALAASELIPFRADAMLALANAKQSTTKVLARQSELTGKFSKEELQAIAETPSVAMAVVVAQQKIEQLTGSTGEFARVLKRAAQLRELHLLAAEANAVAGNIPAGPVEKIKKGSGHTDLAKDCIALAELYETYASDLDNKTPSTKELRIEMSEAGTRLLFLIKTEGTPQSKPEDISNAQSIRDRLWTILDKRYDLLASAAVRLAGRRGAEDLVPPLQSRVVPPKKETPTEAQK